MIYHFADYELDEHLYELRRAGAPVELERKVFDVLTYLVEHRDRLVTKDELLDSLWPEQVVGEAALTRCITAARKALGDDGNRQEFIKTQHGRGYRFVAPLTTSQPVQSSTFQVPSREEESQKAKRENIEAAELQLTDGELSPQDPGLSTQDLASPAPVRSWSMRSLLFLGLLFLVGLLVVVQYLSRPPFDPQSAALGTEPASRALALPDKPSIAVLPFTNMSNDPEQEYFSDGITEDITSDLSRISSLFVIARNSAFTYKGKAVKVQEVGREMGVRYVLEGSVRKANDHVRITAQLIDATTGESLWAERYDRPFTDIFALQDEIRQKIVLALKVQLTAEEQARFKNAPTNNLEAYDHFLRGIEYFWRNTKASNAQARQMFEKAIELDQQYAAAYAWLSSTYVADWNNQWSKDRQMLDRALVLTQKALALNDSLPAGHTALGFLQQWTGEHTQAIASGERAVALDPNNPRSYLQLAMALALAGRVEESIAKAKYAMRLHPHYPPHYLHILGSVYHLGWRNEEAIATLKKFLVYSPDGHGAHVMLTCSYSDAGRNEEARAQAAEVVRVNPNFTTEAWMQNQIFRDEAERDRHVNNLRKAGLK